MDAVKEYLEEAMDHRRVITIKFRSVDGGMEVVKGHVVRLETVSGRTMIETDAGFVIGTDQILDIDGRDFSTIC